MNTASVRSEWLKTWKRPMTLWMVGILLAVVFIRPPVMAGLSRYFVIDTSQGLRIWIGTLPEEALTIGQQIREQMTLPGAIPIALDTPPWPGASTPGGRRATWSGARATGCPSSAANWWC
jgi:hypothetical protein